MRIVDRAAFLAMPPGTLFSKYEPCIFGALSIKGDSIGAYDDFFVQEIADAIDYDNTGEFLDRLDRAQQAGASLSMDFDCESRDGMFDDDQLFAVWESDDVSALIRRLRIAYQSAFGELPSVA